MCEQRLATIKIPKLISRTPHSLEECSSWKGILNDLICDLYSNLIFLAASECWSWILYYSSPVMHDILPAPYIAKLVTSMHICFSDRINSQQLQLAEQQLHEFYRNYQDLYVNKLGHVFYTWYALCWFEIQETTPLLWILTFWATFQSAFASGVLYGHTPAFHLRKWTTV